MIKELPMHPKRVTVWCGFWAGGLIGPYFFENENGIAITVNGIRYREMITNFLWHEIDDMDVEDIWFNKMEQHDTLPMKPCSYCNKI